MYSVCTHFAGNLATGKYTEQIQTYENYTADKAVDGNNGQSDLNYCAIAISDPNIVAWWYVDLGAVYDVESVTLIAPTTIKRQRNTTITYSVQTVLPGVERITPPYKGCGTITTHPGRTYTTHCRASTRYIMFEESIYRKQVGDTFSICEVIVCGFPYNGDDKGKMLTI